jgi:mRNA interferase MazF
LPNILYGDIWFTDLDPTVGHEQAGQRPVLVVSPDQFNQSSLRLVLVLPITTNLRPLPSHALISPPEGGLKRPSMILCEAIRSISHDRLQRRLGIAAPATMAAVQDRLRILMNL